MRMNDDKRSPGFTLLEMVAVVTILVILAGITIPIANGLIEDARVARTLDLVEKLSNACRRYFAETGKVPQSLDDLWKGPAGIDGWNGPYVDRPIDPSDNAFGGDLSIIPGITNFTLSGVHIDTQGLALSVGGIPHTAILKIEAALEVNEDPNGGSVKYEYDTTRPDGSERASFFLMPSDTAAGH